MFGILSPASFWGVGWPIFRVRSCWIRFRECPLVMIGSVHHLAPTTKIQAQPVPEIPTTIKTMGVNITTIAHLRVLIIEIGSTIILMVVEAPGQFPQTTGGRRRKGHERRLRTSRSTSVGGPLKGWPGDLELMGWRAILCWRLKQMVWIRFFLNSKDVEKGGCLTTSFRFIFINIINKNDVFSSTNKTCFGTRLRARTLVCGSGDKSYILTVLLEAWVQKSAKTALAIYVTNCKKHRDPILKLLRDKLSAEEVWINAGDSEVQEKENHLMAGVGASSHTALWTASRNWTRRLMPWGPRSLQLLLCTPKGSKCSLSTFCGKKHEHMQAMLSRTKVMVMTADLARKALGKTPGC